MGKTRRHCTPTQFPAPRRSGARYLGISVAELVSGGSNTSVGYDMRAEVPLVSQVEAGNYTVVDNFCAAPGLRSTLI
jgi:hypothetical protein